MSLVRVLQEVRQNGTGPQHLMCIPEQLLSCPQPALWQASEPLRAPIELGKGLRRKAKPSCDGNTAD